ncbi:MAG: helix-turn-helix domain-containing protein [Patescibacteria group bacterium]
MERDVRASMNVPCKGADKIPLKKAVPVKFTIVLTETGINRRVVCGRLNKKNGTCGEPSSPKPETDPRCIFLAKHEEKRTKPMTCTTPVGTISFDPSRRIVNVADRTDEADKETQLSPREAKVLEVLLRNGHEPIEALALYREAWEIGADAHLSGNWKRDLKIQIYRLRQSLGDKRDETKKGKPFQMVINVPKAGMDSAGIYYMGSVLPEAA